MGEIETRLTVLRNMVRPSRPAFRIPRRGHDGVLAAGRGSRALKNAVLSRLFDQEISMSGRLAEDLHSRSA